MIKTLNNDYAFVNIVGNLSYKEIYINWRKEIDIAFNEDELIMLKRQYHLRILNPFNREIKKYLIRNIIPDIFFHKNFTNKFMTKILAHMSCLMILRLIWQIFSYLINNQHILKT